jgi:hypothetical protein
MPIDPSIPLQAKGVQLESPANQLNMMASAAKLNEYTRSVDEQNALRDLIKSGVDIKSPEARQKMYEISPEMGIKFEKSQADLNKSALEGKKLGVEIGAKQMDAFRERMGNLAFNPSNANIQAHLEDAVLKGEITPQEAQQRLTATTSIPMDKRANYFTEMGVKTEERYKMNTVSAAQQQTADISKRGQDLTYKAATQPVFNEAVGGFVTRPTAANPSSTVIPLANPEDTKKGKETEKGKNLVSDVATQMGNSYLTLQQTGGIKSTQKGAAANIAAASQSSMLGQLGGAALGTPEQAERDFIKSQRPLLVQAIVKATGMSATQINSNVELKNLLDAATDPSKGYETNAKSLNLINKRFGTGAEVIPVNIGGGSNIDALLEKYK